MRIFLVVILVGLISGAGFGWWPKAERESEELTEALRLKAEAALGIRRMLRADARFDFHNVVVGRVLDDGQIDFRGQMRRGGRAEAVYGFVSGQCADTLANAQCWDLTHLEANGAVVVLSDADTKTAAISAVGQLATARNAQPDTFQTADVSYVASESAQQSESPPPDTPHATTHKVARPVINTRSGPGTDNPVLTRLNAGARLSLIATKGGWGNFIILDGRAGGQEVWAALSLLEEAAP